MSHLTRLLRKSEKEMLFVKKNAIIYGAPQSPVQEKALSVLSRILMDYADQYPVCFPYDENGGYENFRCFYIGTKKDNPYIAQNSKARLTKPEEYAICVENDTVMIEGFDDAGVLYGCVDFYTKYIIPTEYDDPEKNRGAGHYWRNVLEKPLTDFACTCAPSVKNRGIWTWGHVIYDYRNFIDNMVKLKMNTIIIWNDFVPFNAKEMIEYAHNSAVKVIWGFAWGWDNGCQNLSLRTLNDQTANIFAKFQKEFAGLAVDGIYFQSITEVDTEEIDGVPVADAVTDFVNNTAKLFFDYDPKMELQFGLHATSVKNRLDMIQKVDPRIRIVWEDCGAFPYNYIPQEIGNFAETKAFTEKIANLRGKDDRFGVVTKAFTTLDWSCFQHVDGPVYLGVSSEDIQANRTQRKAKDWRYFQAYWMRNGAKALEMVKTMADAKEGDLYITALVEDGMFEKNLMYPVALYGEMLWDCDVPFAEILSGVALRMDITFA